MHFNKNKSMLRKTLLLFISILSFASAKAQGGSYYQEIGIMSGPVFFQGDFGEKGSSENITSNVGVSGSLVYYVSLNNNNGGLERNLKVRFDATLMSVSLNHYGKYTESNTPFGEKLRAMQSDVKVSNVGFQLEYYPFETDDYGGSGLTPYIATGAQLNVYTANATSSLGPIGNSNTVPAKYVDGFKDSNGTAFSMTGALGVRYKLSSSGAVVLEGQFKYYYSDWIEGMNPDPKVYKENKNNDFSGTIQIGYIYYLD